MKKRLRIFSIICVCLFVTLTTGCYQAHAEEVKKTSSLIVLQERVGTDTTYHIRLLVDKKLQKAFSDDVGKIPGVTGLSFGTYNFSVSRAKAFTNSEVEKALFPLIKKHFKVAEILLGKNSSDYSRKEVEEDIDMLLNPEEYKARQPREEEESFLKKTERKI